ncbi:MAG: GGDEF domain-containing protein [candidate division WOR-3 bacterium]
MDKTFGEGSWVILVGIGIVLIAFISLFIIEYLERRKLEKEIKVLENRLRTQRITYETMAREQSMRIDELAAEMTARSRVIAQVLHIAGVLNNKELERKEMPKKLLEGIRNIINAEEIFFFEAEEGGKLLVLKEVISKEKEKYEKMKIVYPIGIGPIGYIAKSPKALILDDMEREALLEGIDFKSKDPYRIDYDICARLSYAEQIFGVIAVRNVKPLTQKIITPEGDERDHQIGDRKTALRYAQEALQMIADLGSFAIYGATLREEIQKLADTDGLTGLYNKRFFMELLEKYFKKAEAEKENLGLFIMDIDNFKKYNDTHGHPAGDDLLKEIAKILKRVCGNIGIPARYGGEEFIVILYGKNKVQTFRFGEMVRDIIEKTKFPNEHTQPGGKLTISGGIATYPDDAKDPVELIKKADEALYYAKSKGKNKVFAYRG